MILAWAAYAAAISALIGVAAIVAEPVVVRLAWGRRWLWLVAILGSAFVPSTLAVVRGRSLPPNVAATAIHPTSKNVPKVSVSAVDAPLLCAWIAMSVVFLAALAVAHRRNRRMLRACRSAAVAGHEVSISENFGPALVGALRPKIVIPSWVLTLGDEQQRLIVLHEAEHAAARDAFVTLAGVCVALVFPWSPAVWWQLSRLRLATELDCDRRVVDRAGGEIVAYGQLLVSVGERDYALRHPVLALSHSRSSLGKRIDALLGRRTTRAGHAGLAAVAGMCLPAVVGFVPAPRLNGVFDALRAPRARALSMATLSPSAQETVLRPSNAAPSMQAAPTPDAVSAGTTPSATVRGAPSRRESRSPVLRLVIDNPDPSPMAPVDMPPLRVIPSNPIAALAVDAARLPPRGGIIHRAGSSVGASGGIVSATMRRSSNVAGAAGGGMVAAGGFVNRVESGAMPMVTASPIDSGARPRSGAVFIVRKPDQAPAAAPRDTIKPPT